MKPWMPIVVAAALLLAANEPKQGTKDFPCPPGWSVATEGNGIPSNQNATGYAIRVAEINSYQNPIPAGVSPRLIRGRRSDVARPHHNAGSRNPAHPYPGRHFSDGLARGSDADDEHKPQHRVRISPHSIWV